VTGVVAIVPGAAHGRERRMSETMTMTEAPAPRRATSRMLLVIFAQPTDALRAAPADVPLPDPASSARAPMPGSS
jgi:hypothetical protein